jgi:hypothetical protein
VLEFAGLDERFRESDLETALISKLQQFLLELGWESTATSSKMLSTPVINRLVSLDSLVRGLPP